MEVEIEKLTRYFQVPHPGNISWSRTTGAHLFILLAVQLLTLAGTVGIRKYGLFEASAKSSTNLALPSFLILEMVIGSLFLVGLWRLYKKAPEWLKPILSWIAAFTPGLIASYLLIQLGYLNIVIGLVGVTVAFYFTLNFLIKRELVWLGRNIAALFLAAFPPVTLGYLIHPVLVASLLVAMLIWDFIAVDKSSVMKGVVDASSGIGIPNYFVIPTGWRISTQDTKAALKGEVEKEDVGLAGLIGAGDFAFPAALTAGLVNQNMAIPAVGSVAGMAVGIVVMGHIAENREEGIPALPTIVSWTLGGTLLATLISIFIGGGIF